MTDRTDDKVCRPINRRMLLKRGVGAAALATTASAAAVFAPSIARAALKPEKEDLKFGFIKLTDMAPIAIAKELGYFEDEGLYVTVEPQANWKVLLDRVITGELDGAHMLAGQPLGATIGFGTKAHVITPFSMDLNGNGITVSNADLGGDEAVHPQGPRRQAGASDQGRRTQEGGRQATRPTASPSTWAWCSRFPRTITNCATGSPPAVCIPASIRRPTFPAKSSPTCCLSVTPPPQMPATLEAGTILGYCVGEPWNQQAVFKGIGVPVITDYELWKNNPEKVFGFSADFQKKNPATVLAATKALIRAGMWLDANNNANRPQAVKILAKSEYVGADADVIANSMTGTFEYEKGDTRPVPDFNVFFRYFATYPYFSDAIWYLTQMRRWGQIPEAKTDAWYDETAKKVYRPDLYLEAAKLLIADGKAKKADFPLDSDGYRAPTSEFIDGVSYDGRKPNAYIDSLKIGLKGNQRVEGLKVVSN